MACPRDGVPPDPSERILLLLSRRRVLVSFGRVLDLRGFTLRHEVPFAGEVAQVQKLRDMYY